MRAKDGSSDLQVRGPSSSRVEEDGGTAPNLEDEERALTLWVRCSAASGGGLGVVTVPKNEQENLYLS